MLLNYRLRTSKTRNNTIPIIMIHGLFGNLSNLGTLSTSLLQYYHVIQIDLRNHGHSPHDPVMNYMVLAQDILNLLHYLSIEKCIVIGHSIGGKVAMTLGILDEKYIYKIIIIDIAPKKYNIDKYKNIFSTLNYIHNAHIQHKSDIINIMQKNDIAPHIISFLLKSFQKNKWTFNFDFIKQNYDNLNDWTISQICWKSSLFIRGELSNYIIDSYIKTIHDQFPFSFIHTVPDAKHWVHYDKPEYVCDIIKKFILQKI